MIVTVVTPTLNAVQHLRSCIESLRHGQGAENEIEHIIVDGGSTDGTVELAEAHGLRVMTGRDRGIFDAINKGSFASRGELVGFLGADDVMLPGGINAVAAAYRNSGRRWVVGGIRWIDERGGGLGGLAAPPAWMTPRMLTCLGWNPVMHMGTYFSRPFFTELGGFDINYRDSGDYELFTRARKIERYGRIGQAVACFRRTGINNSLINPERTRHENQAILDRYGPTSPVERRAWRYAMKIWFNAANPVWAVRKVLQPVTIGLRLQRKSYF